MCAKLCPVPDPDDPLPDFARPPVVEVALAVQFTEPLTFDAARTSEVAESWHEELPEVSLRPVLPPMDMRGGELGSGDEDVLLRLWMANEAGNRVVQLQPDRVTVNWKLGDAEEPYPRYESLRQFLVETWSRVGAIAAANKWGEPKPQMCEVHYVNRLSEEQGWTRYDDTSALLAPWGGSFSDGFLPAPGAAAMLLHFHLPDRRGWMNIQAGQTLDDEDSEILAIHLQCRGRLANPDFEDALDFMDLAHQWIVRGFASVTTPAAHEIWRRTA